jgi:hypothetical protein
MYDSENLRDIVEGDVVQNINFLFFPANKWPFFKTNCAWISILRLNTSWQFFKKSPIFASKIEKSREIYPHGNRYIWTMFKLQDMQGDLTYLCTIQKSTTCAGLDLYLAQDGTRLKDNLPIEPSNRTRVAHDRLGRFNTRARVHVTLSPKTIGQNSTSSHSPGKTTLYVFYIQILLCLFSTSTELY